MATIPGLKRLRRTRGVLGPGMAFALVANAVVFAWVSVETTIAVAAILEMAVISTVQLNRKWFIASAKVRLFDHTKRSTMVEEYEASTGRRRQWLFDILKMDLDRVLTQENIGLRSGVKPARVNKWVKIKGVPWRLRYGIDDLRRGRHTVGWSPFIDYPDTEFLQELALRVAHFLALEPYGVIWEPPDLEHRCVTLYAADPNNPVDYQRIYERYSDSFIGREEP